MSDLVVPVRDTKRVRVGRRTTVGSRNGNGSAITAIGEAGLSIPEDISVAGYDNTDLAPLSSIL
jgi:hypothetical protein